MYNFAKLQYLKRKQKPNQQASEAVKKNLPLHALPQEEDESDKQ